MARLIAETGHILELPARHLTFGAAEHCSIPLSGSFGLAPVHFEIAPAGDGTSFLRDASGGAGTLVNGQPVTVTALKDGDVITAGNLVLRFAAVAAVPAPVAVAPDTTGAGSGAAPAPAVAVPPLPQVSAAPPVPAPVPVPAVKLPQQGEIVTAEDDLPGEKGRRDGSPAAAGAKPLVFRKSSRSRSLPSSPLVKVACVVLLGVAAAAFCATDPGQRLISPLVRKVQDWNSARAVKAAAKPAGPATAGPPAPGSATAAAPPAPARPGVEVIPQTAHEEIARRLLTERTLVYLYADLRQLVPAYNVMASRQGLPSLREMSEAFRKTYGAVIDPFERLSFLQADTQDEFLFILTSKEEVSMEKVVGQPARTPGDNRPRIHNLKAGNRTLGAALYDPFTLVLGTPRAIARALQPSTGPQIREAASMFPETAHRTPGALILVKRVNVPGESGGEDVQTAFETIVTNLFLDSTPSTLSLVRNPEVSEKAFVDAAQPAIREQAAALAPALGANPKIFANLKPGDINLTLNEAVLPLPGGSAMIHSALEGLARSFEKAAPSIQSILQAQDAVRRFNGARAAGAEGALKASSSREALELLREGIQLRGVNLQFPVEGRELDNLSALLAIDTSVGLVYRPDHEALTGASRDLAAKAGHYLNAELLISLWQMAKLKAAAGETPDTAAKKVLEWGATAEGKLRRSMMGLPDLTEEERQGALAHLTVDGSGLAWKPGEADYRSWVRQVHPDPLGDATRLAHAFNAAVSAGAIPASARKDLQAALTLITRGVTGRGAQAGTTFKVDHLTDSERQAAAALLKLEDGKMEVTATPGSTGH